jgi:hypothetical protein
METGFCGYNEKKSVELCDTVKVFTFCEQPYVRVEIG